MSLDIGTLFSEFKQVDHKVFQKRIIEVCKTNDFFKRNLDIKTSYRNFDCWLTPRHCSGFAVTPEQELINVFSTTNGGASLMAFAMSRYKHLHLNCFASEYLEKFYKSKGFVEIRREKNCAMDDLKLGEEVDFLAIEKHLQNRWPLNPDVFDGISFDDTLKGEEIGRVSTQKTFYPDVLFLEWNSEEYTFNKAKIEILGYTKDKK